MMNGERDMVTRMIWMMVTREWKDVVDPVAGLVVPVAGKDDFCLSYITCRAKMPHICIFAHNMQIIV